MGTDRSLTHALALVHDEWLSYVTQGLFTEQTRDKFGLLAGRFERFATVRGALIVSDVTPELAEDFIHALGRSRHGRVADSADATMYLRRSVLRTVFRTMRSLGLTDTDPTRDIVLPARTPGEVRPLAEDEVIDLRHQASFITRPSRHGAAAALALAGLNSGEIGHIAVQDLDLEGHRVWAPGSTKTDPRWCPLGDWGLNVLARRAEFVSARQLRSVSALQARLAVGDAPAPDATLQARVCVALKDLLRRIGLDHQRDIKPASITAWAGVEVYQKTGRIEDVALRLGLRSLDRAATVIGHTWHEPSTADATGEADA